MLKCDHGTASFVAHLTLLPPLQDSSQVNKHTLLLMRSIFCFMLEVSSFGFSLFFLFPLSDEGQNDVWKGHSVLFGVEDIVVPSLQQRSVQEHGV